MYTKILMRMLCAGIVHVWLNKDVIVVHVSHQQPNCICWQDWIWYQNHEHAMLIHWVKGTWETATLPGHDYVFQQCGILYIDKVVLKYTYIIKLSESFHIFYDQEDEYNTNNLKYNYLIKAYIIKDFSDRMNLIRYTL